MTPGDEGAPADAGAPPIFWISASLVSLFVLVGAVIPEQLGEFSQRLLAGITGGFGWLFILSVAAFLVACIWFAAGPYAHVRLGSDDVEPEFSTMSWFAMLFSAGMGIGLVFFGVAEPLTHYAAPPESSPETIAAAREAMVITFFHWGLHAWAIYVLLGLALAYATFRRGLPLSIASTLEPLIGSAHLGWPGRAVDLLAVFGTLFGLATSLGLGAMQVNAGLHRLFGVPMGTSTQLVLIALITLAAGASVVSGLDAGVRRLSEINLVLAGLLMLFVLFAGPTAFLLDAFADNLGRYLADLPRRTFWRASWRDGSDWHAGWTIFYWAWWISWAPFVGTFIARISRGRTIREFVLGVLLVPTLLTFLWLTIFGDTALFFERQGAGIGAVVEGDSSLAIYAMLDQLPWSSVSSGLAVLVITLFFVTSSDSGSLVVDMITSGGDPDPPVGRRVFWAAAEGTVAGILMLAGGLEALRAAAIGTGLPFCLVLLATLVATIRGLRRHESRRSP